MKTFTTIVDHKSFTVAAKKLNVSPSKLSKEIAWLENEIKTPLITRSTRQLEITESGEIFYERATQILSSLEETKSVLAKLPNEPHGIIRISLNPAYIYSVITPIAVDFMKKHSGVEFDFVLHPGNNDQFDNKIDLHISLQKLSDPRLNNVEIGNVKFSIFGAPDYFKNNGTPIKPEDLKTHNCLIFGNDVWDLGYNKSTQIVGNFKSDDLGTLIQAAQQGIGLLFAPSKILEKKIKSGLLIPILEHYSNIKPLYASMKKRPTNRVSVFIEYLKNFVSCT